jgi:endonuclease III
MSRKEIAMNNQLKQFTTQELETELLNRQKCQFGRLTCTGVAEDYIIKPFNYQRNPTCFNCKLDILSLKDHDQ